MKKSIIAAGAASVALAAMPIVGAFAAFSGGDFTDIIQTTVDDSCTFGRGTQAAHATSDYHGTTTGAWNVNKDETGTDTPGTDTLSPAITVTPHAAEAGATETTLGSSNFYVVCNDTDGYQVSVTTSALTNGTQTQASQHPWAYTYNGDPTSAAASYWRIVPGDAQKPAVDPSATTNYSDIANNIISTKASAEDGHDFTVTYKAFAITGQDSGTYKATAVYTAAQLPTS